MFGDCIDWLAEKWLARRGPPDALVLKKDQLFDTQRDRVEHVTKAEYHTAMADMLDKRIIRLNKEIGDAPVIDEIN